MGHKRNTSPNFEQLYSSLYGNRWEKLREALLLPTEPIAYDTELLTPYFMDEASIISASALPVTAGDMVLDMCAAPGGKSLILAPKVSDSGLLICNDRSSARRGRLHKVLKAHLPEQIMNHIRVTSHDATKWGLYEKNMYNAILLDAPCSSERHVLQDPSALAIWSPSRTKHLAIQQFAMLASALEAVQVGGFILYSTCSISPLENEEVIAKLSKKRSGRYEEVILQTPYSEPLIHGSIILPDTAHGKGPMYFCLLRRLS
jgi:16S rRNA C967 or C1407 C5-methylase (RsmB/RsmF family)